MRRTTDLMARNAAQFKLAALSLAIILLYFLAPPNREAVRFVVERFRLFPKEWSLYHAARSPEERLRLNYGMNYDAPIFIRDNLAPEGRLQLPPRAYISPYCPPGQDGWTDPRAIYYVAGPLRTYAWLGSIRPEATHALVVDTLDATPRLRIVDVRLESDRNQVTDLYKRAENRR